MIIPLAALVAIAQSSITSHLRVFGVSPDLVLVFTTSSILVLGSKDGLLFGLLGGLMLDAFSGAPFGLVTLSLVITGYLVGMAEYNLFRSARIVPLLSITLATVIFYLLFIFLLQMTGRPMLWGATAQRVILPAIALNAAVMFLAYRLLLWLRAKLGPPTVEWE
jgi:rod shape-determining protein MreD